ncbi:hypothetical protein [Thermomonospora umbrina]|uniref:Uncharacterized protein n=1 Tax=Thermomonospora umbrina TaxID=111806 RepID=A0A3D9SYK4_9ACTN|nr:hypothetical protein [Thermomonospora umbrina]REF00658.1 hypothetical protein DFJ69_6214 [Thermomonospora umbrina]
MSIVRRNPEPSGGDSERLPLRWGVILLAALGAGATAFAFGAAGLVVSTLHSVLA